MALDRGDEGGAPPAPAWRDAIGGRVRDLRDDLPDAARAAVDAGLDLYRRGTMAVTRTAGDHGALMLLAGGAAATGLSWLLLRRRRRRHGGRDDA